MSRYYDMAVKVEGLPEKIVAAVIEAIDEEWSSFSDNWSETEGENDTIDIFSCGTGNLTGGETEEEYSDRVRDAVWKAAKMFVAIEVTATDLENAPFERYEHIEEQYAGWKKGQEDEDGSA